MKTYYNLLIALLIVPCIAFANESHKKGKYKKEKKVHKEFTVQADALLKIDNSYGDLDIVTWEENRTVIDVHIITQGDDEEDVAEKLDEISVDFSGSSAVVEATTIFGERRSRWTSWFSFGSNDVNIQVNYTIKIPVKNAVDLNNDYGSIRLTTLQGKAKINCDYGQLIIGELLADDNELRFDYTTKSTISYMKSGSINADYSGFTLDKVETLDLNADYTTSEINEIGSLDYNCDYGKVIIGTANSVYGKGDYVTNSFQKIAKKLELNADYSSIYIGELQASIEKVNIESEFTGIKIGIHPQASFNFDIDIEFASLKGKEHVQVTKSSSDYTDKSYKGYFGNQNSNNQMYISSEYGGVTLFKL